MDDKSSKGSERPREAQFAEATPGVAGPYHPIAVRVEVCGMLLDDLLIVRVVVSRLLN
jgi:hypothetical protein